MAYLMSQGLDLMCLHLFNVQRLLLFVLYIGSRESYVDFTFPVIEKYADLKEKKSFLLWWRWVEEKPTIFMSLF